MITIIGHARPSVLIEGDMIAIYAGNLTPSGAATLEKRPETDEYTPDGHWTLWTTDGRYEVPFGSSLDIVAWAPVPARPAVLPLPVGLNWHGRDYKTEC